MYVPPLGQDNPPVMSVLIVDGHPSFRASARRLHEAEGFNVVGEVADGHEAIAAALELKPDLVLLDVQLPDLYGFEVAGRLAALGLPSALVLTSSSPTQQSTDRSLPKLLCAGSFPKQSSREPSSPTYSL